MVHMLLTRSFILIFGCGIETTNRYEALHKKYGLQPL